MVWTKREERELTQLQAKKDRVLSEQRSKVQQFVMSFWTPGLTVEQLVEALLQNATQARKVLEELDDAVTDAPEVAP